MQLELKSVVTYVFGRCAFVVLTSVSRYHTPVWT